MKTRTVFLLILGFQFFCLTCIFLRLHIDNIGIELIANSVIRKNAQYFQERTNISKPKGKLGSDMSTCKSLEDIHLKIRDQIHSLQEEGDCDQKKILFCENKQGIAGFGSMMHRYGVCMQIAYGLGRIWFINQYHGALEKYFKPESSKCGYLKKKYLKVIKQNIQDKRSYINDGITKRNVAQRL